MQTNTSVAAQSQATYMDAN